MKRIILVLFITLSAVSMATADTIYLRGGSSIRGNVLGFINGRFAIQLTSTATLPVRNQPGIQGTTRTVGAGEVIFLRPREIDRIEIDGRSLDDARYQTRTVDVSLSANWIDSGVDLRRNERVRIDATGTIYAGRTRITPAGLSTTDPNAPLPGAPEGELIGVIGNDYDSPIVEIGASKEFVADRDGRLYLTINRGSYLDSRGAYNARIQRERDLTAMARTADDRNETFDPFALPEESSGSSAPIRSRQRNDFPNRDNRRGRTLERIVAVQGVESRGADTGIDVRAGDEVTVTATGSVTAGQRVGAVSADGARAGASSILGISRRPLPNAGVGALIGYIRQTNGQNSPVFLVGTQTTLNVPADGRLYLLVNDDNYGDNSGSFSARILYPDNR